uniref:Uncharacterized protein n=1 Tax=Wuchereria bancrofti TaxID=6293 RepID=A0A1I8ES56_WUCBA
MQTKSQNAGLIIIISKRDDNKKEKKEQNMLKIMGCVGDEIRRSNSKEKSRNRLHRYSFIGGFGYFGRLDESDKRKHESSRNRRRDYENIKFDFGGWFYYPFDPRRWIFSNL